MVIHLIAIGQKMPGWVETAYADYAKRLPAQCRLKLVALPMPHRGKSQSCDKALSEEARRIEAAIPKGARIVVLDEKGQAPTTEKLAGKLDQWLGSGQDVALIVGGPDGLSPSLKQAAHWQWSLSPLTLPHPLVRVLLAEQLYRAWSLLQNHPYHRP
ncbi:23S rRNA (pseudouridine(1915)-N(3))-methyltransferase RlmH [Thiomicrospira sp. WB1]|uniref:23S rRNA (pseudouridine(1915)-N(3))-methyltransferase RlmH n=1 Tax=Thiomicrospira sp. WB1 TaxID=1685380 RepID=UPI000746DEB2|nr:23S rRNA (pseudouridine(1915)-N(3))-methyltransferase RlmH [Thiomicrospira sp. WB1]KUJ71335.1 23S rRNA (pseudouridine(1915)-N(3))-methyltransferase RlmH [Thiomicrospira sp. WB1]